MYHNSVHTKLLNLATQEISQTEFETMLRQTTNANPMMIYWKKLDGRRARREMFWGFYIGGKASQTREERGELALVSLTDGGEYRTIQLNEVTRIRFENKTYFVRL
jgi:hypothetical protein